ncbi:2-hydroxyacid dehydrogenase [Propionispora vibrioides]|jgi:D-3-phosphoglycerate dehydrogenase|uniref:D-3-phosphoglycerate dehydrogenase n=1 Tax=Propionispora vibrioides TaxID=112903 RepID=A0A1H8WBE3_9FIRM|nr:2-hydroxyacid dehydrogenase [Propionispora vibrioides]SEP24929.1 D-3-phosphoglycerate dehydrogenase [Propionispora vibrioides]
MLKCLAIADLFIDETMMEKGLQELTQKNIDITVRQWKHKDLEALQQDNIRLEKQGSEAVLLPEELLAGLEEYDLIITQFAPVGKQVIDKAKKLKCIGVLRAGIENVNSAYAREKGITVLNTPGRSNTSVSEFTVGLILSEIRNIARANQKLKEGKWEKQYPNGVLAPELKESIVGLIGYGAIGQRVASLIRPFGGTIIFFDDYYTGASPDTKVSLDELVRQADIISMHYRLTPETKNMLNKEHFSKMKKNAVVINSARSGLINEQDLIEALQQKLIAGAAVDVFEKEPLPEDHPYLTLENVTITPHIAGSTVGNFGNSPSILGKRIINEYLSK